MRILRSISALLLLVLPAIVAPASAQAPRRGGTVDMQVQPWAGNFDPLRGDCGLCFVTGQIFGSLTRLDKAWNVAAYLADSWEVAPDGLSYTFHLDKDATFQDGTPVTAEDVAFSVAMTQKYHRFGAQMFGPVERVDTPDPKTAVFRLSKPDAAVMLSTSTPYFLPIMPKHIYGVGDYQTNPAHNKPVGSGPFKLTDFKQDEYIILDRNDGYFIKGQPYLDRIVMHLIRDDNATEVAFNQGQLQFLPAAAFSYRDLDRMKQSSSNEVVDVGGPFGTQVYLGFNLRRKPLDNKLVRQAIASAIDINFISKTLNAGWTVPSISFIQPTSPFFDPDTPKYPLDLDKANRLLDQAGLKRGPDGVRFETTLTHHPAASFTVIAEYVTAQLAKVGIKVDRQPPADIPAWLQRVSSWDFDMSIETLAVYPDPIIGGNRLFVCNNIKHVPYTNVYGYCNPELDKLLNDAAAEPDVGKRKALYSNIQKFIADEEIDVWLSVRPIPQVANTAILGNTQVSAWGAFDPLDQLYRKDAK